MTDRSRIAEGLLVLCRRNGIQVTQDAGSLVIDAPEAALISGVVEGLREYKQELIDLLSGVSPDCETISDPEAAQGLDCGDTTRSGVWRIEEPLDWDELPEPVECAECGGIYAWWNALGERRCADCDPPTASRRWLERAEQLRRRHRRIGSGKSYSRHGSPTLATVAKEAKS